MEQQQKKLCLLWTAALTLVLPGAAGQPTWGLTLERRGEAAQRVKVGSDHLSI